MTIWGQGGFDEKLIEIKVSIKVKTGINKCVQILITSDVSKILTRVYVHCHNVHKRPPGFGKEGTNEARKLCENITPLIIGEYQKPGVKQAFQLNSQFTYDNYFSGDSIMKDFGKNGFGAVMNCRRDLLPSNIPPQYFHKLKNDYKQRSNKARSLHAVVVV